MFGATWAEKDNAAEVSKNKGGPAPREAADPTAKSYLTIGIATGCVVLLLLFIVNGSGSARATGARGKAVVFMFEGLKATAFEELGVRGNRAPNIRALLENGGQHAVCLGPQDPMCCRAGDEPRTLGGSFKWDAAPGLLSALTGVAASKHRVANNSRAAMERYVNVAEQFPTVLKQLKDAGKRVAAVGSSSLLTSIGAGGACSAAGVLDYECGATVLQQRCLSADSCNLDTRTSLATTASGTQEWDAVEDAARFIEANADVIVVHLNRLNIAATQRVGGDFSVESDPYAAQLYLTDSVVGKILAQLKKRAGGSSQENWLVLGVSDHGGANGVSGTTPNADELVAFFAASLGQTGAYHLRQPELPVRQTDVAPTLLTWFGLPVAENLDGRSQFVCGRAEAAVNCTAL